MVELTEKRKKRLDLATRREAADALWRIFGLISHKIAITFDEDGITIRVPFDEPHDLDGPELIYGVATNVHEYHEADIFQRGIRPR